MKRDRVGDAELGGVGAQAVALRAAAHEHEPQPLGDAVREGNEAAAQRGQRPQHVVVALLPFQPPGRDDDVLVRRAGALRRVREMLGVDPGVGQPDALAAGRPRAARPSSARCGGGEEQVGGRQRRPPERARVRRAEGVDERDRLPDRQHQLVAEPRLESRRLGREPQRELLGVDDVGAAERGLRPQHAIGEPERQHVARHAGRKPVAQRADPLAREPQAVEVIAQAAGLHDLDVEALGQPLPRTQAPDSGVMSPNEQDPRQGLRHAAQR